MIKRCLWVREFYIIDAGPNRKVEGNIENLVRLLFMLKIEMKINEVGEN